jgi:sarcosine oxidase subunit alpha
VIRAREVVLATGAHEQPLVFAHNDRPGVMLSGAVRHHLHAHAVVPGRRVVVATATDDGYRTALDLARAGVEVPAVVDARTRPGPAAAVAEAAGIEVLIGHAPLTVVGKHGVRGLEIGHLGAEHRQLVRADAVAVSGGFAPALHLASQSGARPVFDARIGAFVPGPPVQHERSAGAARGVFDLAGCLEDGRRAGIDAAEAAGFASPDLPALPPVAAGEEAPFAPRHVPADGGEAFVDLQNDVTVADLRLAVQEGYGRTEHAKRYTTLGMATDQGKTSGLNGLAVLAAAKGCDSGELAPTTFRPPYTPVAVAAFAGHERGVDYQPVRRTAMHRAHERLGAIFGEAGHWLRPRCYPRGDESLMEAAAREAIAVRAGVGLCDVSTLGKIEIRGPDARELLNRVYVNAWSKLAVGKARYGLMLREDGIALDDGTTTCLADDHFLMSTTTANAAKVLQHLEFLHQTAWPELDVALCSATEQWCATALAGPRSRDVLGLVLDGADVSNAALPFMGVLEATAGGAPVRVFRISFSGELAYELACPWGYGEALWERVLRAGAAFDITPYGTEALAILRIEKGHPAGQEFDGRTTAGDLGMARLVSAKKRCVGRTLAERAGLADPERPALVGLAPVDTDQQLRGGAHLVEDPADARTATDLGWTSSVHWSPHVGAWIALAFVAGGLERWRGRRLWAVYPLKDEAVEVEVRAPCFVDPEGVRPRG